ncbi:Anti-sigma-28 factor FlgM family protein [Gemmatirosa kalamazoonensis]|uniref:Anti-sigma-28 factor FlgM family protein n=1 Tax=Gemmatirosa kalamazoonensis TaxID=861299 RepID=W0REC0_9BACT|nr:flagellar biosynthesis anti-sigma factor FlgM [Gemmatirosa kalamazoonensis]AHG87703.1 Anti-sigma-28 factor FlgM family protein [Gemmatirosa kalamazoonensis]
MKIQGQRSEALRPATQTPAVQGTTAEPKAQPAQGGTTGTGARRSDSVQISDAGRALSTGETSGSSSLTPERVAELRRRVLEGAYNANHVVSQVAQRILERGDV